MALRRACRAEHPDWWNAPVHAFGDPDAWLALAGLAPGKHGANRTGRPFTGDYAGELLYATLAKFGLSEGKFDARPDDGLSLREVKGHGQTGQAGPDHPMLPQLAESGYLKALAFRLD